MKILLMGTIMTEEMMTIIRDNEEHLKFLHERLWDTWIEYNALKDKIHRKEAVIQKLLDQAMPNLAITTK